MKTLAKTALCAAYKYSGLMRVQEALASRASRPFMAILVFHRVTDAIPEDGLTVGTARFRRICRMLRRGFRVVPLAELFRLHRSGGVFPSRTVALSFDDCYRDNLFAARVLAEHGLPAAFFIPTGYIGTDRVFAWDRGIKRMPNLTWDDVRAMAALGFDVGSHSVSHPNMGELSLDEARAELAESKAAIEAQLDRPVRWFAYPFGGPSHFRPDFLPLLDETGYDGCLSAFGGFVYPETDGRVLPREPVPYFRSVLNLELHLTGCLQWFYAIKHRMGYLDGQDDRIAERIPQLSYSGERTLCRGY